jgi:hypothetical protein
MTRNMTIVYVALFATRTARHSAEVLPELSGAASEATSSGAQTIVVDPFRG